MNIELLQGQFKVIENSNFDSTDPRLDEIATLAQAGEYSEDLLLPLWVLVGAGINQTY
jgi:hypothetical protein